MLRLFCCFLVALFFSVQCLQRQILYSRLDKEVTNFSLTVLHEIASLIHCADLCSRDDYCMEFVYSETSGHCIGLHCLKTDNYAYQYVSPTPYRGLYFGKGKILFMIIYFKPFTLISNNLIMVSLISSFYSEQLGSIFRSPLLLCGRKRYMGRSQGI